MTDTSAAPETGLKSALETSLRFDHSDWTFDQLLKRKADLLGNARAIDELTPDELSEFHACSVRLRQIAQPAGKPATRSKKAAAAPVSAASVADDFT